MGKKKVDKKRGKGKKKKGPDDSPPYHRLRPHILGIPGKKKVEGGENDVKMRRDGGRGGGSGGEKKKNKKKKEETLPGIESCLDILSPPVSCRAKKKSPWEGKKKEGGGWLPAALGPELRSRNS